MRAAVLSVCGLGLIGACGFDDALREYLSARFWLPFRKSGDDFARKSVARANAPFAGMAAAQGNTPLAQVRAAYQGAGSNPPNLEAALEAARADASLSPRDREELALVDAKADMRTGSREFPEPLNLARQKFTQFIATASTPEFLSEARGWLAHVYFVLGDQTAAGKIYLDELNYEGSNLSEETILTSLRMTYGYDGGSELLKHLEEYFDTPEHAAFAIQLVTNPHWSRGRREAENREPLVSTSPPYAQIKTLLERHAALLRSERGADLLALLGMRAALRAGDPPAALRIAGQVPARAATRTQPDFLWMSASANFLSHRYAAAGRPLLALFRSARASADEKAAAAYALCGVYQKTGNFVEQIRFALWLRQGKHYLSEGSRIEDQSVYWAASGWDLNLLLDAEAPTDALRRFIDQYPNAAGIRMVKYSLAVRLARENRYEEAATIYEAIGAARRAPRMHQLAALYRNAQDDDGKYRLAEFISAHPDGIYFNDILWSGLQRYALFAARDGRFNREELEAAVATERKLKDEQEERWRAYLLLREISDRAGQTEVGRKAARLAIQCVRRMNTDRFGREDQIVKADLELSARLHQ